MDADQPPRKRKNVRAGKPPALSLYAADWLADGIVSGMEADEEGTYWRLLLIAFREFGLPNDEALVRGMTKIRRARAWPRVWAKIRLKLRPEIPCGCGRIPCPHGEGRLRDARQEKERLASAEFSALQKDRADRRWHASGIEPAVPEPCLAPAPALAGGRAGSGSRDGDHPLTENLSPNGDERARRLASFARWREEFARLWSAHPPRHGRKANKPKAWEAYRALRPTVDKAAEIWAGHERAVASKDWIDGFVPDLHRWIKATGWGDEFSAEGAGWKERFLAKGDK